MKKLFYILLLINCFCSTAQKKLKCDCNEKHELMPKNCIPQKKLIHIDEYGSYNGGLNELKKNIRENLHYPKSGICISGKFYINFDIDTNGFISDLKIVKGFTTCPEYNEEAIRVINLTQGNWAPAKTEDKLVKSNYIAIVEY